MTKMARFKNGLRGSRTFPLPFLVRHLKQERRGECLRETIYSPVFLSVKTPRAWLWSQGMWVSTPHSVTRSLGNGNSFPHSSAHLFCSFKG